MYRFIFLENEYLAASAASNKYIIGCMVHHRVELELRVVATSGSGSLLVEVTP